MSLCVFPFLQVFVRELISNASDALEKLRYLLLTDQKLAQDSPLEIHIATNTEAGTFTIQVGTVLQIRPRKKLLNCHFLADPILNIKKIFIIFKRTLMLFLDIQK